MFQQTEKGTDQFQTILVTLVGPGHIAYQIPSNVDWNANLSETGTIATRKSVETSSIDFGRSIATKQLITKENGLKKKKKKIQKKKIRLNFKFLQFFF